MYLLYPMYRYEEKEDEFPVAVSESPRGNINVHFIRLPFIYEEGNEEKTNLQLTEEIHGIFGVDYTVMLENGMNVFVESTTRKDKTFENVNQIQGKLYN